MNDELIDDLLNASNSTRELINLRHTVRSGHRCLIVEFDNALQTNAVFQTSNYQRRKTDCQFRSKPLGQFTFQGVRLRDDWVRVP